MKESIIFQKQVKGFTLIELLIVIAILAILATIVLVIINPVQMFAQARDSQRIYDLNTLSNAVALYLTTVNSPSLQGTGASGTCAANFWASFSGASNNFNNNTLFIASSFTAAVDGTGWVPVIFSDISGGSPISTLPKDPINDTSYFYSYACQNTNKWFEFHGVMESMRYANGGSDDVETTDGGINDNVYEIGNKPGLNF